MSDGAQWISALAACVSAATALTTYIQLRRDKAKSASSMAEPAPGSLPQPPEAPREALAVQALAVIRAHNLAYDRALRAPLKIMSSFTVIMVAAVGLQAWLTPDNILLLLPVSLIVSIAIVAYWLYSIERKKEEILADGHKQLSLLIEAPQFTLDTANQLRASLRREATPVVIVEVDDLIFRRLSKPA